MMKKSLILALALVVAGTTLAPAQGRSKIDVLCDGDPALAVMRSDLLTARKAVKNGASPQAAFRQAAFHAIRDGKLQCIIGATAISGDLLDACKKAKLEVVGTYAKNGLSQLIVRCSDPRQLDSLARRSDVRIIMTEPLAHAWVGSVTSQAYTSINVDQAFANYGVDGTGITVGVLSDSFYDTRNGSVAGGILTGCTDQNTGDLPASVRMIDRGPNDGTTIDEGNGMAQLVYDLAPGCDISFASAFTDYFVFADNIIALATDPTAPADVIVDDVIYFVEPMYQDGPIAISAASAATVYGVPYFSSAGNNSDDAHERTYVDVNPGVDDDVTFPPTGVDFHDFGLAYSATSDTHLEVSMQADDVLTVVLHWDEPYGGGAAAGPGSEADLDVYIVNNTMLPLNGNILASGDDAQGTVGAPSGDSVEVIQYQSLIAQPVYIVVDHYAGRDPVDLHLWVSLSGGGSIVEKSLLADRTIFGHAAAENVVAVAANRYDLSQVEPFSSKGGNLPFWFSPDGNTRFGAPVTRFKPEITAPDGTDTTFFGGGDWDGTTFPNFFGTSAAAPHAAAVAALMLDASNVLTTAQIYSKLRSTATDIEALGVDDLSGSGIINANAAVGSALSAVSDWTEY